MAKIFPFKGVRSPRNLSSLVGSRTYKSYSPEDLIDKIENNPYTFLQIIEPDYLENQERKLKGKDKFLGVKRKYNSFKDLDYLQKDNQETIYVYEQTYDDNIYRGLIVGVSVDDYKNDIIKKHEATLPKKEKLFSNYLNHCGFNAEPVLVSFEDNNSIQSTISAVITDFPCYDFNTTDKVRHRLWSITNKEVINNLTNDFATINSLYIADGHHRSASSCLLHDENKVNNKYVDTSTDKFMAYLIPESQLSIYEYNRILHLEEEIDENEILKKLNFNYWVTLLDEPLINLDDNCIQVYLKNKWYLLRLKLENYSVSTSVDTLDSQILTTTILEPIFNVKDLKNDNRFEFFSGKETPKEIEVRLKGMDNSIAFFLKPITIDQLKKVADDGLIMPPKSTFIEPKLRSGLVVYEYERTDK